MGSVQIPAADINPRSFWSGRKLMIGIIAVAMALFHLYTSGYRPFPGVQQRAIHLSFALALIFLLYPFRGKQVENSEEKETDDTRKLSIVDVVLLVLSLSIAGYLLVEYEALSMRVGMPNLLDTC
jgi:TRAP-type uncharacterized transport system fused permease subunit